MPIVTRISKGYLDSIIEYYLIFNILKLSLTLVFQCKLIKKPSFYFFLLAACPFGRNSEDYIMHFKVTGEGMRTSV